MERSFVRPSVGDSSASDFVSDLVIFYNNMFHTYMQDGVVSYRNQALIITFKSDRS